MGKKRQPLQLGPRQFAQLSSEPQALDALLQEPGRGPDLVRAIAQALAPAGILNTAEPGLRLQVLTLLEERAVDICSEAPQDALRQLYENVRDRAAAPGRDTPATAARLQLAALATCTQLLIKLDMPQRDARLVKVHVETLFRLMERSGPHAAAPPELCRCAATCLRLMEEASPTLLLAGSKQLLELARREAGPAAESYVMLAARVLAHGAQRCLDARRGDDARDAPAAAAPPQGGAAAKPVRSGSGRSEAEDAEHEAFLAAIDVRAVELGLVGGGGGSSGGTTPAGARDASPAATLDAVAQGMSAFASGRTAASSDDLSSPKQGPGSPRAVASLLGTATTCDDSARSVALGIARHASIASSEISGSVALDGGCAQPLLPSLPGPGLRHFRVPQHLHWPDALAAAGLLVYLPPEGEEDLRRAALELLAALPALGVEGVACVTSALPPVLRLAALPPAELAAELEALLHSGRTLLLQAVLKLHGEVPEGLEGWRERLLDAVLMMVGGPHPVEQRVVAITWCLVQHHAQMHAGRPSLFAGAWRQLLPRADDPPQLLSLKVKGLSACLAVGIGRAEEICPMVFAWDGFWQRCPGDQHQRLATYALRMLGSAAAAYAALPPGVAETARRPAAGAAAAVRPAATPHYVRACLLSACLQLLATRPQYLPAVEAFLAHCASCSPDLHLALLNAVDAMLSAAAAGTFACLAPLPPPQRKGQPAGGATGSPRGSPPLSGASSKPRLGSVLQRVARSVSKRFSPNSSPDDEAGSLAAAAAAGEPRSPPLPPLAEQPAAAMAAPQPPQPLASWPEAEAWLWDSRTWAPLCPHLLAHDPLAYRSLLLRLAQAGPSALPMGALRFLAAYAGQYRSEQPGHALPAKEAGSCLLAICQAAAMTHLLVGPQAPPAPGSPRSGSGAASARSGRGRARQRGTDDASAHGGVPRGASPGAATDGTATPQWTAQQEEVAAAMQAVLAALTSHFPVESVRRRAQSFLDLLANPSAWDLKLRVATFSKMLGGYFSDAVSIASYL